MKHKSKKKVIGLWYDKGFYAPFTDFSTQDKYAIISPKGTDTRPREAYYFSLACPKCYMDAKNGHLWGDECYDCRIKKSCNNKCEPGNWYSFYKKEKRILRSIIYNKLILK